MKKAIIGKKLGMTQLFDDRGNVIPVTAVEAGPCVITQVKTVGERRLCGLSVRLWRDQGQPRKQAHGRSLQEE